MFRRFVRASVGATPTKMDSEELLDALNATLVHLGVRRAARLDSGTSSSLSARFVSSMKRNGGLRVVKWSDDEPIVIRENDAVAQSLCERLMRTEEDDEHHAIMGRLLGYGCPWVPSSVDQCWMFNFVVFFRRSNDDFKSRESGWLGGFKCIVATTFFAFAHKIQPGFCRSCESISGGSIRQGARHRVRGRSF